MRGAEGSLPETVGLLSIRWGSARAQAFKLELLQQEQLAVVADAIGVVEQLLHGGTIQTQQAVR